MNLAIFGGTFNPIHLAHVALAEAAFRELALDALLLAPSATPPHKASTGLAPAEHRLRMAQLAAAGRTGWHISDLEVERGGRSYSIDTVRAVTEAYHLEAPPYFLIGADMLQELAEWWEADRLVELCRFAVAARPGSKLEPPPRLVETIGHEQAQVICGRVVPAPLMDISSTDIRSRVAQGQPIDHLVPAAVSDYIREHALYA